MKKANLSKFTTHSLRHSFTSMLGQIGVSPKVAQELLGHTNIRMTMDVYSHVMPGMKESAIDQLGSYLSKEKPDGKDSGIGNPEPENNAEVAEPKDKVLHEAKVIYLSTFTKCLERYPE